MIAGAALLEQELGQESTGSGVRGTQFHGCQKMFDGGGAISVLYEGLAEVEMEVRPKRIDGKRRVGVPVPVYAGNASDHLLSCPWLSEPLQGKRTQNTASSMPETKSFVNPKFLTDNTLKNKNLS